MYSLNNTEQLEAYFDRLWPLNRSITGPGFRESLEILAELMPMDRLRFQSGEEVLDWSVPLEWRVRDAYILGPDGKKHCEFKKNNLHLVGYSTPFSGRVRLDELKRHMFTLEERPDAIPYITSYYKNQWGFCISYDQLRMLPDGEYQIVVDTELLPGHLEIGEAILPGSSKEEVFFSSYLCHPSMANNELSGPLALVSLYQRIMNLPERRYTYRFILSTETIGTIAYLSKRGAHLKEHAVAGYQVSCVGDRGDFTYKRSRQRDALPDRSMLAVLRDLQMPHQVLNFDPGDGSDERQYCSPGFDLPCGSLMRTKYGAYPEYHTSLDNKSFISFEKISGAVDVYFEAVKVIEGNRVYRNLFPNGEPRLGSRGLYPETSEPGKLAQEIKAIMWVLNYSDGSCDLLEISSLSAIPFHMIFEAARKLSTAGVITPAS